MKDELFNRHIESARHSLNALRERLRTSPGAPGVGIAGHLDDIGTALDAAALEWSQQRDALAASQTKIAEGARAAKALRESEEVFHAIAYYTADWENWIGPDGKLLWVNPAVEQVTGYSVAEFRAMHTLSMPLSTEEDRKVVRAQFQRAMAGTRENDQEFRFVHKDGTTRWASVSWQPIFARDGTPLGHRSSVRDITKRKQLEKARRESEEQYRRLFDNSMLAISQASLEGRLVRANMAYARMYGYASPEQTIAEVTDIGPQLYANPEDRQEVLRILTAKGIMGPREMVVVRRDGTRFHVEVLAQEIRDVSGRLLGYQAAHIDITERKRAEEERLAHLRFFESMDRINRAMQGTNDLEQMMSDVLDAMLAIFDCDRASLVYPCDPEATSWHAPMERTRPEYPGALALGLEVPMDPDVVRVFRTLQASSGPVQFGPGSAYPLPSEVSQRFGSQSQIAMALYPKEGKPWMFVLQQCSRPQVWTLEEGTLFEEIGRRLTDVLTSLLTHRDLRESEARLRSLFENSMVGILLTAPDGRVYAANPAACRLFGRTEEDICRLGRSGLVDRRDARIKMLVQERAEKGYAAGEMTLVRADGTCFTAQVSSVMFETADGRRCSMVLQDISARKLTEERIHEFTRKLLSVREEEKRRFSAVLHHDVGSFTVGVTAYLNAVEEDLRKGQCKEALASLKKARRLFVQSVRRLKTLAVELRPPDLDILGLPAALRQHFSLLTNETSLRVRFTDATCGMTIPPETQTVLFRVAQESLNNVVKHAHARQVKMRLSAPRKTLRLSITDDGKGFDPVYVAAKLGAHLGLQVAREMVAALGGEILVDASPGRGTTVLVTLPQGGPKA